MRELKPGDVVWYQIARGIRAQAEILESIGNTHVKIKMLTSPTKGQIIEAPRSAVEPLKKTQE